MSDESDVSSRGRAESAAQRAPRGVAFSLRRMSQARHDTANDMMRRQRRPCDAIDDGHVLRRARDLVLAREIQVIRQSHLEAARGLHAESAEFISLEAGAVDRAFGMRD